MLFIEIHIQLYDLECIRNEGCFCNTSARTKGDYINDENN